ncbi:hypothetical protein [Variovorax sp. UC122_21]
MQQDHEDHQQAAQQVDVRQAGQGIRAGNRGDSADARPRGLKGC